MKSKAIKWIGALLVVAIVVVSSLAIAGVFDPTQNVVASAEATVQDGNMHYNMVSDTVLYLRSTNGSAVTGDASQLLEVCDNMGNAVKVSFNGNRNENGNPGFVLAGGWVPGMAYSVRAVRDDLVFDGGDYDGASSFICTIKAPQSEVAVLDEASIYWLNEREYNTLASASIVDEATIWTLMLDNNPGSKTVFIFDNKAQLSWNDDSNAYDVYAFTLDGVPQNKGTGWSVQVKEAELDDIFTELNINKDIEVAEKDFQFDAEGTIASFKQSELFLSAVDVFYGNLSAEEKEEAKEKRVEFKCKPSFKLDPARVDVNITVKFKGILQKDGKPDMDSSIELTINNTITPNFSVHVEDKDKKAFDVAVKLDVVTTATIRASYVRVDDSRNPKADQDVDIKALTAKLAKKVNEFTKADNNPSKPYIFAHWTIPVGTLPICIEYDMGLSLQTRLAAEIGVGCTNSFSTTFGAVYLDKRLQGFGNVEDDFRMNNLSLMGNISAKVGLVNEIGISAYGVVGVSVDATVGVYGELGGRFDVDCDQLMQGTLDVVPTWYVEAGVFVTIKIKGKVFKFTIKEFTALDKKFPLFKKGHQYIPVDSSYDCWPKTDGVDVADPFDDETMYLNSSYFYLTTFDVMALNLKDITAKASKVSVAWDEFDYQYDEGLLSLKDNRFVVTNKAPAEFKTDIVVTSKVNKGIQKVITLVRNPEVPTVAEGGATQVFDTASPADVYFHVMMNGSKYIGTSLDGVALVEGQNKEVYYNSTQDTLIIYAKALTGKAYGAHKVLVEASRGYLPLEVKVASSANVTVADSDAVYDKAIGNSVVWSIDLQGSTIKEFNVDNYQYRDFTKQLVVGADYLASLDAGSYAYTLTLQNGENEQQIALSLEVKDNRLAKLDTTVYEYVAGSADGLQLDASLYADTASKVVFNGVDINAAQLGASLTIPGDVLKAYAQGDYHGTLHTVGGRALSFTVSVLNDDAVVVPVKYAIKDKADDKDVVFTASIPSLKNLYLALGDVALDNSAYALSNGSVVIRSAYLKSLGVGAWNFAIMGGDKKVVLTVEVSNSALPHIVGGVDKVVSTNDRDQEFNWDLAGYQASDIIIPGLTAEQYAVSDNRLVVKMAALPYGVTSFVVYTPVNELELKAERKGEASLVMGSCDVQVADGDSASFVINPAHYSYKDLKVTAGGKDVEILPTQYRYREGSLDLTNDFVYSLNAGTYTVTIVLDELNGDKYAGKEVNLDATLRIVGEPKQMSFVGDGISVPYGIYNAEQLVAYAKAINDDATYASRKYVLKADIDMMGHEISPIGTGSNPFTGVFDGDGYTILNLSINKSVKLSKDDGNVVGMFGVNKGEIRSLRLVNPSIKFADKGAVSAGILAGRNEGRISGITILAGSISAESKSWLNTASAYFDLGGVVGYNLGGVGSGIITNVKVDATIEGKVKGLNIMGIQITGRKSLINVGAVVGYFSRPADFRGRVISYITANTAINAKADNNNIVSNGWYGNSDLDNEEAENSAGRIKIIAE